MSRPTSRVVLHVDMDAFFASVELLRRPELRGLPVVVGGAGPRGVVAAASYEARRYGLHSAMASTRARRLCPQAVFLAPDHAHYADVSARVHDVFQRYTPLVEPLALDEAFLDLTGAGALFGDGPTAARAIRAAVLAETGLACSVGVAPNKFLAKLASEAAKPTAEPSGVRPGAGVVVVGPGDELAFLHPHHVRAMWGVGPVTQQRLDRLGVHTIGDLAALGERALVGAVGAAQGRHLALLSMGIDDRAVEPGRRPKSIGHEETFPTDVHTIDDLHRHVVRMADLVAVRLRGEGLAARTVTLKVRFATGFQTVTRSVTHPDPLDTGPAIVAALADAEASIDPAPGVRLIGVSGSNLNPPAAQLQLGLFADGAAPAPRWADASTALDEIRARYGPTAIGPASTLGRNRSSDGRSR